MTICKGTSQEDGRETIVLVLNWVTPAQLEAIKTELTTTFEDMGEGPLGPEGSDEVLWHGLINMLCDLEVEGYEMS